jgi:diguanylate cyclase
MWSRSDRHSWFMLAQEVICVATLLSGDAFLRWGLCMQVVSRRYRWTIYSLLVVVIAAGIALFFAMASTTGEIRASTTPLLEEKIPTLRHLSDFEAALLRYQLTLNKYFVSSLGHTGFEHLENQTALDMERSFEDLHRDLLQADQMAALSSNYEAVLAMGPALEQLMATPAVNQGAARKLLGNLDLKSNNIRVLLGAAKRDAEQSVYRVGDMANVGVDRISWLVKLYCIGMLAVAMFMMYHVWARFRSENALAYQAAHDPLTGLGHRGSFERRLKNMAGQPHTVVLGMIDRFERVIGGLGHAFGDRLMQELAGRIKRAAERYGGEVFRLDGANVAILYKSAGEHSDFQEALSSLQDYMRQPFEFDQHEIFSSMSMGGAQYPRDGTEAVLLLQNADAALQAARDSGGDCFVAYSIALNTRAQERLALESLLRHAIERNELELYFQPQQRLADDSLVGFEALVRWRRNGELIPPAEFIPLAEECGLIVPIGDWVLAEACRQAKIWSLETPHKFVIAVNISPRQFHHPSFLRRVTETLTESMIDPSFIELEITEGIVMRDVERTIDLLKDLRKRGLTLAIDDFGTGYSSLAYLKRFSIDKLKIDQSFVRHLRPNSEDAAIVQAVINLGHHLGLSVIAEGVETSGQRELLRSWGCDEIQGYFYGRPLSAAKATQFIFEH